MNAAQNIARTIAQAFLAGDLEIDAMESRVNELLPRKRRWVRPLAERVYETFRNKPRPRLATLTKFVCHDRSFAKVAAKQSFRKLQRVVPTSSMTPVPAARDWSIPPIESIGALAVWLGVSQRELAWFEDRRSLLAHRDNVWRHYRYRPLTKRRGCIRMIEAPKPRLKAIQRRILSDILESIPVHPNGHGFCRGRSIATFAEPHVAKNVVMKLDLQDFFPSVSIRRIQALFRTVGYPEPVADSLARLCTTSTPQDVWPNEGDRLKTLADRKSADSRRRLRSLYERRHLPQGAPTSPAISNLCAFRLDCRLSALAQAAGAVYTRYADDLAFSGDSRFANAAKRFQIHAAAIVLEEGFRVHYRKTRIMKRSTSQRVAGLVVNERLNVSRKDIDRLKATLNNCVRGGAASQNRDHHPDFRSHIHGRITFVESINPNRGRKLRELFEKIEW